MDSFQKPNNSECCTKSSEPFRFYLLSVLRIYSCGEKKKKKKDSYGRFVFHSTRSSFRFMHDSCRFVPFVCLYLTATPDRSCLLVYSDPYVSAGRCDFSCWKFCCVPFPLYVYLDQSSLSAAFRILADCHLQTSSTAHILSMFNLTIYVTDS
jgi:hypothetical protein